MGIWITPKVIVPDAGCPRCVMLSAIVELVVVGVALHGDWFAKFALFMSMAGALPFADNCTDTVNASADTPLLSVAESVMFAVEGFAFVPGVTDVLVMLKVPCARATADSEHSEIEQSELSNKTAPAVLVVLMRNTPSRRLAKQTSRIVIFLGCC